MEDKIRTIITQVGDVGEKLSDLLAEETIPAIEKDIILRDIRILYEAVKNLQLRPDNIPSGELEQEIDIEVPDPEPMEDKSANEPEPEKPAEQDQDIPEPEKPVEAAPDISEPGAEETEDIPVPADDKIDPEKSKKPGHSSKAAEPAILADRYKGEQKYINESLAGKQQDLGSKIHSTPISNIGSALGINDRFSLINELFNGDKESFQSCITVLDGASNFNEAFNYISSSFEWDMEDDSVQLLLDLVRRKFIVNQNE